MDKPLKGAIIIFFALLGYYFTIFAKKILIYVEYKKFQYLHKSYQPWHSQTEMLVRFFLFCFDKMSHLQMNGYD